MKVNTINITNFLRVKGIIYTSFIGFFLCIHLMAEAKIFTTTKNGSFDQKEIWTPGYPGNVIGEDDTVVINNEVRGNIDVVVKGTMIIQEKGSLTGENNVIIVKSGTLFNLGVSEMGKLTNRGAIYNQADLTVLLDFINSGNILNYKSVHVGNMLDNTGLITGTGGEFSANRKFINSRTGTVKGYVDVCSNNFLNVEGGTVDTEKTTFCSNPIFNDTGMMAQYNDPIHYKKSVFAVSLATGQYAPF